MAKVRLVLDIRKTSRKRDGTYPIALSVYHKKPRYISLGYFTTAAGWDLTGCKLKKSAAYNKSLRCEEINQELDDKLYQAKCLLRKIGKSIDKVNINGLIELIKDCWDNHLQSDIKKKVENNISLSTWGETLMKRKKSADKPGTAKWYSDGIAAVISYNKGKDIKLFDITVSFLKDFEAYHLGRGNSKNTISIYLRAVRAIYNSAIDEDVFVPLKNSFESYTIPSIRRTKKRARTKGNINNIKALEYPMGSPLWHSKNYAMIMFYCRGMNFIDLVQLKAKAVTDSCLYYGRSKSDHPFAIKIVPELMKILEYYLKDKTPEDYLFPTNYDGSTRHFQKYKSQRRRMNERLRIIAKDAGIEGDFTTYYIRHSWATIAKYLGISTEIISEALGHRSLRTTEIYLKDFDNRVLDETNSLVVS